ncbi:MAG: M36 family metallopeptidase [Bacteroidota bacterium]
MPYTKLCLILACWTFLFPAVLFSQSMESVGRTHLLASIKEHRLLDEDLAELRLVNESVSRKGGLTHLYFQQQFQGIDIFGAHASVHISKDQQRISYNNQLEGQIRSRIQHSSPTLHPTDAILQAANHLGLNISDPLQMKEEIGGKNQAAVYTDGGIAHTPIEVFLEWKPIGEDEIILSWSVRIQPKKQDHWWTVQVNANEGGVVQVYDWVQQENWTHSPKSEEQEHTVPMPRSMAMPSPTAPLVLSSLFVTEQYRVIPFPIESPNHGARQLVSDPADATASPYGWHDVNGIPGAEYTVSKGNNVDAYLDVGANNNAVNGDADRADGGSNLIFDFSFDGSQSPASYQAASLTNVFYWTNVLHDVLYQYGFDEAAGNFQTNTYGRGGSGNDAVRVEAQDGGSTNNASFATPPDGYPPRMQLYLWNHASPDRTGEMDAGILIHEYGHGLTSRLIGGPSNSFCLLNGEQMSEGWSDWLALLLTIEAGDSRTDARGLGTYVLNQPITGVGDRPTPYSTDTGINDFTYGDLPSLTAPYGVGYGWASILWEISWDLIDEYGFDPDWYAGTGGNNIALQLVIEGLKLQACNPGYVSGRDAILQADEFIFGSQYKCLLWQAFARRGLGVSADQGSEYDHTDGTEAFDLPSLCRKELQLLLSIAPDSLVAAGDILQGAVTVRNQTDNPLTQVVVSTSVPANSSFVSGTASHGGSEAGGTISFPGVSIPAGDSIERTYQLQVSPSKFSTKVFEDDQESGASKWTTAIGLGSQTWAQTSAFPMQGSMSWFADDLSTISDQYLTFGSSVSLPASPWLQFWHLYETESGFNTGFDGGVVEISDDNGNSWADLGPYMKTNGYTKTISSDYNNPLAGRSAFAGNSGGYVRTDIDLSDFVGKTVLIRFRMGTDSSVGSNGWYIDEVQLWDLVVVEAAACVTSFEGDSDCDSYDAPGAIILEAGTFPVEWAEFEAIPELSHIHVRWATAIEEANAGFRLERSLSSEFTLTESIAWIEGQGTSLTGASYQYDDWAVLPGITYYYRLKQLDLDGRFSYSDVVAARLVEGAGIDLRIFPNPASGSLNISFFSRESQLADVSILNSLGQLQAHSRMRPRQDRTDLAMDISDYAPGVYLVQIRQGLFVVSKRLIIH